MQLDQIRFVLRPRQNWTALDLGFSLAQRWWLPMALRGAITLLPVLGLAIFLNHTFWSFFVIWWFKPLYERIPMKYLSGAVFAASSDFRALTQGMFDKQTLYALTFCRFSWRRSAVVAISLEEESSSSLAQRKKTLYDDGAILLLWLAIVGNLFEVLVSSLVYEFATNFFSTSESLVRDEGIPLDLDSFLDLLALGSTTSEPVFWETVLGLVMYSLVILVVMPFYVAAGFSLYLNRRTMLEGWDIEVGFKKLIQRLGLLVLVLFLWVPQDTLASETTEHETVLAEVRNSEDFNQISTYKQPIMLKRFLDWVRQQQPQEAPRESMISNVMAFILEIVFWIAIAGLIGYFLYRLSFLIDFQQLKWNRKAKVVPKPRVREDALTKLPKDTVSAILRAWENGEVRQAHSLLYLGALNYLREVMDCRIAADLTEAECLRRTRHVEASLFAAFRSITLNWQRVAYAGESVGQTQFEEVLAAYRRYFLI